MSDHTPVPEPHARAVRLWLLCVAVMIFMTLVVGGATRLTESGLSITEWKPVTGVVPPLSQAGWQAEFERYRAIPQYRELNRGMSLEAFKVIYWWEWSHRLLWCGWVPKRLRARLWAIFGAGAFLGAVGWWMVSSGLAGRVSVSEYRLAFHLALAAAIYGAVLWTAQQMTAPMIQSAPARLRIGALVVVIMVLIQIYLGALVAGLDAGLVFNTWPLMDGSFIPPARHLWFFEPAWRNLFENRLTVQFEHRMMAYAIWLAAMVHANDAWTLRRETAGALILAGAVTLQAMLGIVTLLEQSPIPLALAHQIAAILVFTIAVVHAQRLHHHAAQPAIGPAEESA